MRYGEIPTGGGGGEVRWRNESHTSAHPFLFFLKFAEEGKGAEKLSTVCYETIWCFWFVFGFFKSMNRLISRPSRGKLWNKGGVWALSSEWGWCWSMSAVGCHRDWPAFVLCPDCCRSAARGRTELALGEYPSVLRSLWGFFLFSMSDDRNESQLEQIIIIIIIMWLFLCRLAAAPCPRLKVGIYQATILAVSAPSQCLQVSFSTFLKSNGSFEHLWTRLKLAYNHHIICVRRRLSKPSSATYSSRVNHLWHRISRSPQCNIRCSEWIFITNWFPFLFMKLPTRSTRGCWLMFSRWPTCLWIVKLLWILQVSKEIIIIKKINNNNVVMRPSLWVVDEIERCDASDAILMQWCGTRLAGRSASTWQVSLCCWLWLGSISGSCGNPERSPRRPLSPTLTIDTYKKNMGRPFQKSDRRYLQLELSLFPCNFLVRAPLTFDPFSWSAWLPTTIGEPPPHPAANPAWPWATRRTVSGTWVTWRWWAGSWIRPGWPSWTAPFPPTRSAPSPPSPTILATTSRWGSSRSRWSSSLLATPARGPDCSTSLCTRAKTCWKRRRETSPAASSEFPWGLKRST